MTIHAHIFLRVNSALSGGKNIPQSGTGKKPNNELWMARRFVPMVDWTRDDEDTNAHMSDISLRLPAARAASDNSALVTLSQAVGDLMRKVPGLHPKPTQTGVNPWQLHYPSTYRKGSPAVHGLQETGQLVTQRESVQR